MILVTGLFSVVGEYQTLTKGWDIKSCQRKHTLTNKYSLPKCTLPTMPVPNEKNTLQSGRSWTFVRLCCSPQLALLSLYPKQILASIWYTDKVNKNGEPEEWGLHSCGFSCSNVCTANVKARTHCCCWYEI
jgi:hypothetical protein